MPKQLEVKLECSYCGKSHREVRKLIAGPTVYICDECIKLCKHILAEEAQRADRTPDETTSPPKKPEGAKESGRTLCCSFCGKSQREVKSLIAGPSVYICDECICLCNDIIREEIDREEHASVLRARLPEDVRGFLAGIFERGLPAARRIRDVLQDRIAEEIARQRVAGEAPDSPLWLPLWLAADWTGVHALLARAAPEKSESGEVGPLEAGVREWVSPIAERLAGTLEVLGVVARGLEKPGLEEVRQLLPSVKVASERLRESRELLLAGPPRRPAEGP